MNIPLDQLRKWSLETASFVSGSVRILLRMERDVCVHQPDRPNLAPQRFDPHRELPDFLPDSWNCIIGLDGGKFAAILLTKTSARNIIQAVEGDDKLSRLEKKGHDEQQRLLEQVVEMEGQIEQLEKETQQQPEPDEALEQLRKTKRQLQQKIWAFNMNLADETEEQYLVFRSVLTDLREKFQNTGNVRIPGVHQMRTPHWAQTRFLRRKNLLVEFRKRIPGVKLESIESAWIRANPRPRRVGNMSPTNTGEADMHDEEWRNLRLRRDEAEQEFETMRNIHEYNQNLFEVAKDKGEDVPPSEVFHASALWDKVRIIKKLTAAEDKYREATRKLRAMGRCPTTIDSTHVSNPTTDIDIGDAALLYHQPRFRAKVDAWKAKVPRFEPQHYTYTDRHYVRSPVLFPLDSPKGELSEIPQLYDWDCKSVPIGQCLSDPGTKEAAAQIRAWKRLQRDAAKQLVGTPKRERSQSQSDSSSRKKRKEGDGMITFPANFKYPVFTYQGSAVQPVTSKPPP